MFDLNDLPANSGVVICGHGSRAKIAEEEFSLLAKGLIARYPNLNIEYGFLEYSAPNIHMALDRLIEKGVKNIYAVPGMLFAATHAKNDIPSVLTTYEEKNPGLTVHYGAELGLHENMINAFQQRILEAMDLTKIPEAGELYDTMLVVVGRGTSVATANAEAAKLTRIVSENLGFGWSETVYSGVTYPSVGAGLEMAVKLGFKKIVVAPYFLFSGRLIERIYAYIDKVASEHSNVTFYKAKYLRDHDGVIDTFISRIQETVGGGNDSVGLMEDFQRRLAAGEVDVHHHHAEYQPEESDDHHHHHDHSHDHHHHSHGHDHSHSHGHHHSHNHDHVHDHSNGHEHSHHHHAPYKHIAHPYGPRTMIDENVCCCFMSQFPDHVVEEERQKRNEQELIADSEQVPTCQR